MELEIEKDHLILSLVNDIDNTHRPDSFVNITIRIYLSILYMYNLCLNVIHYLLIPTAHPTF